MSLVKNLVIIILFLNCNFSLTSETAKKVASQQIQLNPQGLTLNISFASSNNAGATCAAASTSVSKVDYKQILDQALAKGKNQINGLRDYIAKHKYFFILTSSLSFYLFTYYKIYKLEAAINTKESWIFWKSDYSLEKLLIIDHKNLTKELLSDIQKKYASRSNPDDYITPLNLFINEIDKNIQDLNDYLKWVRTIQYLRIGKIYFINDKKLFDAQEKLNKLLFIKNTFSNFTLEFKQQKFLCENPQETKKTSNVCS